VWGAVEAGHRREQPIDQAVSLVEATPGKQPHRSLALASPVLTNPSRDGPVTSRTVLDGLHHVYGRAA